MSDCNSWKWEQWWDQRNLGEKIVLGVGLGILGLGLATGLLALYGWLVQSLWNWLMPSIFGLKTLDFWQALGLPALIMLLFLGVGGGDKSASGDRKRKKQLKRYIRAEVQASEQPRQE